MQADVPTHQSHLRLLSSPRHWGGNGHGAPSLLLPSEGLTGYVPTRLTRVWVFVPTLHPLSGWTASQNHVSSSGRKSRWHFSSLGECILLCGDTPWITFFHQELCSGDFLTLLQLVIPGSSLPLCTRFAKHEHACGCLRLPCFDPIHVCKEGSFLLHGMVLPCSFFFQPSYLAKNATGTCVYLLLHSLFSSLPTPPNYFGIC